MREVLLELLEDRHTLLEEEEMEVSDIRGGKEIR